jgi:hypothetical protein
MFGHRVPDWRSESGKGVFVKTSAEAGVQKRGTSAAASLSQPDFAELMERAYVMVAIASPSRPPRNRVEWLVGGWERGARAVDALLAEGFLQEIVGIEDEPRLALGERRWPVRLPGESAADRAT